MRSVLPILLLLLPLTAQAEVVSFDQAWQQLQHVSDKLKAENQQVEGAKAQAEATKALDLPSLSISGSYTHLADPVELDLRDLNPLASLDIATLPPQIGPVIGQIISQIPASSFITQMSEQDIFTASLQAMWPIYTGGKITAAQRIKQAQVTEKQQSMLLAKRELFTTLVDRYYAVAVTEAFVNTQAQLVNSLQKHVDHAKALEQQGQISKVERLNAEVALANANVSYGSAQRQQQMAQIALAKMLHQSQVNTDSPLFMLANTPSLPQITQLTMSTHPALALIESKERQAQGLVDLEKSAYLPKVFLYGNYKLYSDDSIVSEMAPDWMVGVGVKVPLISNSGRGDKVEAAKSALLQARYTKAQTKQDLSLLLDQTYRQLQQAQEEVNALNTSFALAKENLRLRELAFNQGLSTSIEQVDAELKLNAVETKQIAAKYRYIQAYARLMAVSGQLQQFISHTHQQEKANAR